MNRPDLIVDRFAYCPWGTYGQIALPGDGVVFTAEEAWRDNADGVSCIPDGVYIVRPDRYNAGGYDALEVQGVPGRDEILFHKGNHAGHVDGCIVVGAVGERFVGGYWAVGNSGLNDTGGFPRLMRAVQKIMEDEGRSYVVVQFRPALGTVYSIE